MKQTAGFTLFELLLAVLLLSILYSVFIFSFQSNKHQTKQSTFLNPKDFIVEHAHQTPASLICFDNCKKCVVVVKNKVVYESANTLFNSEIEVLDFFDNELQKIQFPKFYHDEVFKDVCLKFDVFANGANSNYVIKLDDSTYQIVETYFNKSLILQSEDEVLTYFDNKQKLIPMSEDDFAKE